MSTSSKQPAKATRLGRDRVQRESTPWLWLLPVCILCPILFSKLHYSLPSPQPPLDANGIAQPSEEIVLGHIGALENIGYRTVGTEEAEAGELYVEDEVRKIVERCEANGVLECDLWVQRGNGYHEFTIMDHDVLKVYAGIVNIILKVRAKNPPSGKAAAKDSILLGAHIDSTLPSPGAADDGMGVGVMLDIARVLVDRNQPFDNSVVFMWNGGEETLQDGSHLYSTQHESAQGVRAVINLEAAGTTGGALLFQATSKEMIEAFQHAPYPRGTVIAADVFSSGIMISDTDFGQFEQYLNVTGLDMAIVGHSYYYHTRKDILANIERGSAQHFTSNVMAIVDFLLSPESPLHIEKPWSPPDMVYMSLYDRVFFYWSMASANYAYVGIATVIATLAIANTRQDGVRAFFVAFVGAPLGTVAGVIAANIVASIMVLVDRKLTWFSHEGLCVALYGPASLLGQLSAQYVLANLVKPTQRHYLESAHYYAQLLSLAVNMLLLQAFRIRSAYLFAGIACTMLVGAAAAEVRKLSGSQSQYLPFVSAYIAPLILLVALAMEAYTTTLDIFVPLTGRMGKDAPTEWIIATITAASTLTFFPVAVPMFHRISRRTQRNVLLALVLVIASVAALFSSPVWSPFDATHPKRIGVQYTFNHTSGESTAHLAFMDSQGNRRLAEEMHTAMGPGTELTATEVNDSVPDWDTLYPISSFLETYRFPLPDTDFVWPEMGVESSRSTVDSGERIHLRMNHSGLVWPALSFDADLVDWSFDFKPPHGRKWHHIKAATSVDEHIMELELTVKLEPEEKFRMHWSAIDLNQMVPGTAARRGPDMPASKWLMEFDEWALDKYKGSLDICMNGIVVGVIEV